MTAPVPALQPELQLAFLFLPAPYRARVTPIFSLRAELLQLALTARAPEVVRLRLQWWRDELPRRGTPAAGHPLLRTLAAELPPEPLVAMIEGAADLLAAPAALTAGDALEQAWRTGGAALVAAIALDTTLAAEAGQSGQAALAARAIGTAWRAAEQLAGQHGQLPPLLAHTPTAPAGEALASAHRQLAPIDYAGDIERLLQQGETGAAALVPGEAPARRLLFVLAAQTRAQLALLARHDYRPAPAGRPLGRWRALRASWRGARRSLQPPTSPATPAEERR